MPCRLIVLFAFLSFIGVNRSAVANDWPGFRGPACKGVVESGDAPVQWDATTDNDPAIRWRSSVPGLGHGSPVVFGNKIYLTTAISEDGDASLQLGRSGSTKAAEGDGKQTWAVLCYEKTSGQLLWQRDVKSGEPRATRHTKATHANTSVAVDKNHVVAFFGSEGLYCLDHDGNVLWEKDLGVVDISKYGIGWGYASSPAIHDDRIVLVCDAPDDPYLVALDLETGEEVWRKSRKGDCERSWGTALIHPTPDLTQVVVNGWPWIVAYDLSNGDEVWRIEGGGDNPTPTPFAVDGRIYITNSHGGKSPIIVVKETAKGNLTEAAEAAAKSLVWKTDRGGSYMSTPVVVDGHLYLGNTNGVVRCFDSTTGDKVFEARLGSKASLFASLVAAGDKIYCPSEDGTIYVIRPGDELDVIAKNPMGEPCFATPAISGDTLLVRTTRSLFAIEGGRQPNAAIGESSSGNVTHSTGESVAKKNVLFIAVDDLRPNLGCYGDPHAVTPNIDRLASRGVQFNRAYCQVAVCNPSRASLMTGLRPDKLGVWTLPIHFREAKPDAVTIPQWFRKHGYVAVSHGKIFHNPTPDPQSWSEPIRSLPSLPFPYPDGTRELVRSEMEKLPKKDWRKDNLRRPSTAAPDLPDNQVLDGARTDMAIEDLRRLGKENAPFFLAMGYIRPHLAWVAPKKYWEMHDPEKLPVPIDQKVIEGTPAYAPHNNSELSHYVDLIDMPAPWDADELTEAKKRQLIHGYYACVSYVDAQIGRLLSALEEEGLADNTIVVLWSDHGWKLGENRGWGKMTNYEIDARVPLIISDPVSKSVDAKTDQLVELLDIYPTLCEMVGIETPDFVDGKSLVRVMKDPKMKVHDEALSQYYRRHEGCEYMGYSMRTDQYRLVEWRDFSTGEVTDRELYDHQDLPFENGVCIERTNMIDSAPTALVDQLTKQLAQSHPPRKLVMTPAIHSNPNSGRWRTDLTIKNQTDSQLLAFPITTSGKRGRKQRISPNESTTFQARIGGVYVIESQDGTVHEIHSPSFPAEPLVID